MSRKGEYLKYKAILKMNAHLFEDAVNLLDEVLSQAPNDVELLVYAGCCNFLLDNPTSNHISRALAIDRSRTKNMLYDFYVAFFEYDPLISDSVKRRLKKKIDEL